MSAGYKAVQWNAHKRRYDAAVAGFIVLYLASFVGVGMATHRPPDDISPPILLIRALATLGIVMLHIILAIGPLARLDARFAPLLYNRRHLGVAFFLVALAHALLATLFYGGFGVQNPASAVLAGYGSFASVSAFPFEVLGFAALLVFFVMAATSHDFWLANLSPRVWKWVHMSVYAAYFLVVGHVVLGALQSETSPLYAGLLFAGVAGLIVLHGLAGLRDRRQDRGAISPDGAWVDVGDVGEIAENAAKVVCLAGRERVAVFRHGGRLSAVSNVCAHQGGPLGEGRVIDGCITCPWHGYQYRPGDGQSPPPYTEKIPTYRVRVEGRRIMLNPEALAPGTPVEPAIIPPAPEEPAP
ncbi:MAG: ferric reductase-like transmembrane domain-containing protein [Phycisphaerales bacterium]|nr:ferric reductase-like transmembrane domain-containing protein [Phycisphaerales bacterium]